jgi:hypothetical protein
MRAVAVDPHSPAASLIKPLTGPLRNAGVKLLEPTSAAPPCGTGGPHGGGASNRVCAPCVSQNRSHHSAWLSAAMVCQLATRASVPTGLRIDPDHKTRRQSALAAAAVFCARVLSGFACWQGARDRQICAQLDGVRPITTSAMSSVVMVWPTRCRMMSAATRSGAPGDVTSRRRSRPTSRDSPRRSIRPSV